MARKEVKEGWSREKKQRNKRRKVSDGCVLAVVLCGGSVIREGVEPAGRGEPVRLTRMEREWRGTSLDNLRRTWKTVENDGKARKDKKVAKIKQGCDNSLRQHPHKHSFLAFVLFFFLSCERIWKGSCTTCLFSPFPVVCRHARVFYLRRV